MFDGAVVTFATTETGVIAGGLFNLVGGDSIHAVAELDSETGAATSLRLEPSANTTVSSVHVDQGVLYVAGFFSRLRGVPVDNLAAVVVATVGIGPPAPRSALALHASRPNPVRRDGVFEFDLPHAAPVALDLLDVRGRRVRSLLAVTWRSAGPQRVSFARGVLPAGLYFARLRSGGSSATTKLVVVD